MSLSSESRARKIVVAKRILCHLGSRNHGIAGKDLAEEFKISQAAVSRHIARGEQLIIDMDWNVKELMVEVK